MFCTFGWLYNRVQNYISLFCFLTYVYFHTEGVLKQLNLGPEVLKSLDTIDIQNPSPKLKTVTVAFMFLYCHLFGVSMALFGTEQLKKVVKRERPNRILTVRRMCNMRKREKGMSMPSGDSASCAL